MSDSIFQRDHRQRVAAAIGRADSLGAEGHAGLRGRLREILVRLILSPVMPPEVRSGSGQLVNVSGLLSGEIDVILYAPSIMPPGLFDDISGYFPIESALYTIEVKSRINAREVKKSIAAARAIRALPQIGTIHYWPTFDNKIVGSTTTATPFAINALFAFGSDLSGDPKVELQRYRKYDENADTSPAIAVICVVGRGYWYFSDKWKYCPSDIGHGEVMAWLSGTVNTVPELIVAKGRPRFGNYLVQGSHIVDAT